MTSPPRGTSLAELLMVVALLALLATGLALRFGSGAARATSALKALTLAARLESVRRDLPVAVVHDPAANAFEVRLAADGDGFGDPCRGHTLRRFSLNDYRRVSVFQALRDDLVWLPTGLGRSCSGAGVYNDTIVLGGAAPSHKLVVSSAGRIRSERLP